MATKEKEAEKQPEKIEVKDFREVSEPKDDKIVLKNGEVLMEDIEAKTRFVTNAHAADNIFNDEKKFKTIKKK